MKKIIAILCILAFVFFGLACFAQDAGTYTVIAAAPTGVEAGLVSWLLSFIAANHTVALIIAALVAIRVPAKVVMTALDSYAKSNLPPNQYATVVHYEGSPAFKTLSWILDTAASIKLPVINGAIVASGPSGPAKVSVVIALLACLGGGVVGCTTKAGVASIDGFTVTPALVASGLQVAAHQGALALVKNDPNAVAYLQLTEEALAQVSAGTNYSTATLSNALASVSVDSLKDAPQAQSLIVDLVSIYDGLFQKTVAAKLGNTTPYLVPALQAISTGIAQALPVTNLSTITTGVK